MIANALDERSTAYKVAATAQTIASTYATAQEVFKGFNEAFPQPYGMIAGGAAAGAAVGIGLANVKAINSNRMQGGQVLRGQAYEKGERGDEFFIPDTNGRVVPNHQLGGGAQGMKVNIYNYGNDKVTAEENGNGELDIYVRRDELPDLMAGELANVNSQSGSALNSTYNMQR